MTFSILLYLNGDIFSNYYTVDDPGCYLASINLMISPLHFVDV